MAKVQLTESQVATIVEKAARSVIKAIMEAKANEISDDTLYSAWQKSKDKSYNAYKDINASKEEKNVASKQRNYFEDAYHQKKEKANEKRRAVMNKNERDIDSGKRTFDGKKWTTKQD